MFKLIIFEHIRDVAITWKISRNTNVNGRINAGTAKSRILYTSSQLVQLTGVSLSTNNFL